MVNHPKSTLHNHDFSLKDRLIDAKTILGCLSHQAGGRPPDQGCAEEGPETACEADQPGKGADRSQGGTATAFLMPPLSLP
jgi:hypothetical protein